MKWRRGFESAEGCRTRKVRDEDGEERGETEEEKESSGTVSASEISCGRPNRFNSGAEECD